MTSAPASAPATYATRGAMAVLMLFVFVNYLDRYSLSILLEPIKREFALSDTQVGLLTGAAFALLYSTLALPVARLAERRNRVRVMIAAVLLWSVGVALCGLAGGFVGLFVARMLVGSGEAGAIAPAHSVVGDGVPLYRRGSALAVLSLGGALGTAMAPLIGGVLEQAFGWRGTFLLLGALGVPVAFLLGMVVRDPPRGFSDGLAVDPVTPPPSFGVTLRRLFRRRSFALLVPAMVALGLGEYSLFLWLPSYLARTFSGTTVEVGSALTIFQGIPLIAGTLLGGVVADRLVARDRRWLVWLPAIACAMVAVGGAFVFTATSRTVALVALITPSLACGMYLAPAYASVQALSGARSRATATATLIFAVNLIGLGLGPVLIGGASDLLKVRYGAESLRFAFFLVPPLYLLATIAFAGAGRYILADIADAEAECQAG